MYIAAIQSHLLYVCSTGTQYTLIDNLPCLPNTKIPGLPLSRRNDLVVVSHLQNPLSQNTNLVSRCGHALLTHV